MNEIIETGKERPDKEHFTKVRNMQLAPSNNKRRKKVYQCAKDNTLICVFGKSDSIWKMPGLNVITFK